MTYLYNDPVQFADELIDGFVAANSTLVRKVHGGVVRASRTPQGQVAVVIGGGSGHYPAFAGLVGPGLAHGAAMGNLFASPSAQQIYTVAKAAAAGAGVLFTYGNYAGDVLNFDQAQDRLIAEGIPCRTVVVTDDISSASAEEAHKRRGVAGDLAVFRAAAYAAERGDDLNAVWTLANRANEHTRSFGVAFTGCTLPGASAPLFTVPEGRMAVGMGIHGEPGISEQDVPTAHGLAELLVQGLVQARPGSVDSSDGARVGVILNGLGSVKYEELFVTYGSVSALLSAQGMEIVDPEVGELVTSFQMAGVSLTLFWLDAELEEAWTSPAYTPAYRKGLVNRQDVDSDLSTVVDVVEDVILPSSAASRASGVIVLDSIRAVKNMIDANVEELGRLDSVAGDGDHGIGMQRGATAALLAAEDAAAREAGAGSILSKAGDAWADRAGGTSGALWGLALNALAAEVGDDAAPTATKLAAGVTAALAAIARFGKAQLGDKTMVDVLSPVAVALTESAEQGLTARESWRSAALVASDAADATSQLLPKIGRARPHMEKSLGSPDPGAVSLALAIDAIARVMNSQQKVSQ
ncbi:dihydroxyacetone kinase family protein [Cryobacterium sp. TMS1-20-1]|uniref:dihydroxyacetone kinase family protein n=1 Tax=Cryobacterium sp. TMS1-20-1 TaxID=1259223 RepID=UPI00106C6761|nr:dihydroxyacetone kinase family protein [Cryobacterium sp. TMS1-20-1]TFC71816.1 dihydroxyacetone kinase family protein [Cryobacterium sp. TMS1-20-1]